MPGKDTGRDCRQFGSVPGQRHQRRQGAFRRHTESTQSGCSGTSNGCKRTTPEQILARRLLPPHALQDGGPKLITAAARKLARITFHLLTSRQPRDETVFAVCEKQSRTRVESKLRAQAKALGFQLVRPPVPCAQESVLSHGNDGPPTACPCIHQKPRTEVAAARLLIPTCHDLPFLAAGNRFHAHPSIGKCWPQESGTTEIRYHENSHAAGLRAIERSPARIRHVRQSIG